MFADLLAKDIQPGEIDVQHIPDIEISKTLRGELQKALKEEEDNFVKVSDKTAVVKTDKNYVFFSNQWLYLAVLCKGYAEALKPYGDFLDSDIWKKQQIVDVLVARDYTNPEWIKLLPNKTDRERMIKFIESNLTIGLDNTLLNADKPYSMKDVFGSCILKKIAVPDASSAYLGNLVYYLVKRPELYDALEEEIKSQIINADGAKKLSTITKNCAKEIVDCIYELDGFEKIKHLFEVNEKNIKVDIAKTDGLLPNGNFLRYLFARPSSDLYRGESDKPRVFIDREYDICVVSEETKCRLTTEWVDADIEEGGNGNFLKALILIVNKYYEGRVEIRTTLGEKYMYIKKERFELKDLPKPFQTDFARRYITSLLAKPFVILTGNSGTGKTRISRQFAEYLEWKSEEGKKNWIIVPVGADWTDNAKVLGFYNPLGNDGQGKYEKTKIVEFIEEANQHKEVPYFLILDEMNLSHVERYFSDFLSHMETPDIAFELDRYPGKLEYPKNLFVVGTVNIDETTYMFSPKVLDRANVIEFKPQKDDVMKLFGAANVTSKVKSANDGSAEAFFRLAREIQGGKFDVEKNDKIFYKSTEDDTSKTNMEFVEQVFSDIYEITEKNDFEFAFRTVKEIRQYISAAYELTDNKEININQAIDEQLFQKILPKIHGNNKEIKELLDNLEKLCYKYELVLSAKKIEQMKGKLAKVQYASFI